ncbi:MAG: MGMT family protein [Sphingobacteriaceae bacterium]|jgi:methylated-DNA-protein-cysteine methyltransferase-like protein|nr:MAG: MGMT family protein [Pedobacter sp.]
MDRKIFYDEVYQVTRLIPRGRVTSYGAIAAYLGTKSSSRMVGYAMNASHTAQPPIPAHRVVNRNGLLTGKYHFETPSKMAELLAAEGVQIVNDQVVDFKTLFWDPAVELEIN